MDQDNWSRSPVSAAKTTAEPIWSAGDPHGRDDHKIDPVHENLLLTLFDGGGCGVCFIDQRDAPLACNATFREIFASDGAESHAASDGMRIKDVLGLVRRMSGSRQEAVTEIEHPDGRSSRILLRCLAAHPDTPQDGIRIVLAVELDRWTAPSIRSLQTVFGLTPAEARIAASIGAGQDVKQAAACNHVSVGTARTYLKSVFDKTHTRRQSELTVVLGRLSLVASRAPEAGPAAAPRQPARARRIGFSRRIG